MKNLVRLASDERSSAGVVTGSNRRVDPDVNSTNNKFLRQLLHEAVYNLYCET